MTSSKVRVRHELVHQAPKLGYLELELLLDPLQLLVPGLQLLQLMLLEYGPLFPLGPAAPAGKVVEVTRALVAGLGRVAQRRQGVTSRRRPSSTAPENWERNVSKRSVGF